LAPDQQQRHLHNLFWFSVVFWVLEAVACGVVVALRPHYNLLGIGVVYYLLEIIGTIVGIVYVTYQALKVRISFRSCCLIF
jgi:hypothetical protein